MKLDGQVAPAKQVLSALSTFPVLHLTHLPVVVPEHASQSVSAQAVHLKPLKGSLAETAS